VNVDNHTLFSLLLVPLPPFIAEGSIAVLEPISKMHLTLNSRVADLLKMLTYYAVCSAFSSVGALLLSVIYYFLDRF
jgi:hypothetical protein